MDEGVTVEDAFHVLEVDPVDAQIARALILIPSERANPREQFLDCVVFRHSEAPEVRVAIRRTGQGFAMTVSKLLRQAPLTEVTTSTVPWIVLYIRM
jgi:hypothetical protein